MVSKSIETVFIGKAIDFASCVVDGIFKRLARVIKSVINAKSVEWSVYIHIHICTTHNSVTWSKITI